jgi:uncharacterized protein YndB with AHSA1/START domain
MPNIHLELIIETPVEKIYSAITSQEGLSAWWTPGAEAKPIVDSIARFPFGPEYFKEMKIVALTPPEQVKWVCITGTPEWIGTKISFTLQAGSNRTLLNSHPELQDQIRQKMKAFEDGALLTFHHDDWKEYTPMYAECSYTWAQFLRSLKSLCETGKGRPWPNQHRAEVREVHSDSFHL